MLFIHFSLLIIKCETHTILYMFPTKYKWRTTRWTIQLLHLMCGQGKYFMTTPRTTHRTSYPVKHTLLRNVPQDWSQFRRWIIPLQRVQPRQAIPMSAQPVKPAREAGQVCASGRVGVCWLCPTSVSSSTYINTQRDRHVLSGQWLWITYCVQRLNWNFQYSASRLAWIPGELIICVKSSDVVRMKMYSPTVI